MVRHPVGVQVHFGELLDDQEQEVSAASSRAMLRQVEADNEHVAQRGWKPFTYDLVLSAILAASALSSCEGEV